ncbi:DUF1822 family protein [Mastigocoleus sp. MO_188.B34]|uniref:DUF1822 family protein n=1 Tax=Mastigocoleus sp. MO_188.B34 TaxID=3036635 RepID=UPI002628AA43|nr:DUF1822 family protein [Mastigocoleus sp. MO_188.B34]MDJ0697003.1 DUF1822 family protein [Mastigocoleus sp. MO_188.B34]
MNNNSNDLHKNILAFKELEIINLEPEQTDEAWKIVENFQSHSLQVYFQALGFVGFREWLQKREPNLVVDTRESSLSHPESARGINAVCNVRVGEFKVCLLPTVGFSDELVSIPLVAIDEPEFAAHFYVVVGVEDDLELAAVRGFIRYDNLVELTRRISVLSDDTYEVSFADFQQQTGDLLLYLQCLSAVDIPLPISQNSHDCGDIIQGQSKKYLQKAMNVGLWFQNKLDEVAQELSWNLLATPSPLRFNKSTATPAEDLEDILSQIEDVEIPAIAARSYGNIQLGETQLRLYALTWCLPETPEEWSLLVILGAIPGNNPPFGVKLQISDLTEVLDEQVLEIDRDGGSSTVGEHDCLYAQIVGDKQEKFLVTVTAANGEAESSVLFGFC